MGALIEGVIVRIDDTRFVIKDESDLIQRHLASGSMWETSLVQYVQNLGTPEAHLVNVGAHIGTICVPAASRYALVTAFEPMPENFQHLKLHRDINSVTNMCVVNAALSDTTGLRRVVFNPQNTGGTHVVTDHDVQHKRRHAQNAMKDTHVVCCPLDRLHMARKVDVLLVDIEGHEEEFITGAERTLRDDLPHLIIEIWTDEKRRHENMISSQQDVIQRILSLGYHECTQFAADTFIFTSRACDAGQRHRPSA